jgi:aspartyl-tRNA(Asn)/glutamyl-tRNA(Gln) amidotransferase subunit C
MVKGKTIDEKAVRHIAKLSRISLADAEVKGYREKLAAILGYIDKLNEVDSSGTPPTSHPLESLKNVFRKDTLRKSLEKDEALQNAPRRNNDFFSVPKIIE